MGLGFQALCLEVIPEALAAPMVVALTVGAVVGGQVKSS